MMALVDNEKDDTKIEHLFPVRGLRRTIPFLKIKLFTKTQAEGLTENIRRLTGLNH